MCSRRAVGVVPAVDVAEQSLAGLVGGAPGSAFDLGRWAEVLPAGCTSPVKVTGFPAPNTSTTNLVQVNSGTTAVPVVKLAGEWPPPSPDPKVFALTMTCANSKTGKEDVTDEGGPAPVDVVGVGSDTTENVFDQFSADYNASHKTSGTQFYGWDATNPITGAMGDTIWRCFRKAARASGRSSCPRWA